MYNIKSLYKIVQTNLILLSSYYYYYYIQTNNQGRLILWYKYNFDNLLKNQL